MVSVIVIDPWSCTEITVDYNPKQRNKLSINSEPYMLESNYLYGMFQLHHPFHCHYQIKMSDYVYYKLLGWHMIALQFKLEFGTVASIPIKNKSLTLP